MQLLYCDSLIRYSREQSIPLLELSKWPRAKSEKLQTTDSQFQVQKNIRLTLLVLSGHVEKPVAQIDLVIVSTQTSGLNISE